MGSYPKQPGQDAEAHRRVVERSLAQANEIKALKAKLCEERDALSLADLTATNMGDRIKEQDERVRVLYALLHEGQEIAVGAMNQHHATDWRKRSRAALARWREVTGG